MLDQLLKASTPTPRQTDRLLNSHISHRQRDDAYILTIVQLDARWRLIFCKNQNQWFIQIKEKYHQGFFRGIQYLTNKDSLIKACGALGLLSEPNTRADSSQVPKNVNRPALINIQNASTPDPHYCEPPHMAKEDE